MSKKRGVGLVIFFVVIIIVLVSLGVVFLKSKDTPTGYTTFQAQGDSQTRSDEEWRMGCRDLNRSCFYPGEVDARNLRLKWSFTPDRTELFNYNPAVVDGIVYATSAHNRTYAINASNGSYLWNFSTGAQIFASPAVSNNLLYFTSVDKNVYALNASNGSLNWIFTANNSMKHPPLVIDDVLFVGTDTLGTADVYAINATYGTYIWNRTFTNAGELRVSAYGSDYLYISSTESAQAVNALNMSNGSIVWTHDAGQLGVYYGLIYSEGNIFAGSWGAPSGPATGYNLRSLNATDGSVNWVNWTVSYEYSESPDNRGGMAFANNQIYVSVEGSSSNGIFIFDADTGDRINYFGTLPDAVRNPVLTGDGVTLITGADDKFYALDAIRNETLFSYDVSYSFGRPAVADGVVYVPGNTMLYAFESACNPSSEGDWNITEDLVCRDRLIEMRNASSIIINDGVSLTLQNITLITNSTASNSDSAIRVLGGGALYVNSTDGDRSNITSANRAGAIYTGTIIGYPGATVNIRETDVAHTTFRLNSTNIFLDNLHTNFVTAAAFIDMIHIISSDNAVVINSNISAKNDREIILVRNANNLTIQNNSFVPRGRRNVIETSEIVYFVDNFCGDYADTELNEGCVEFDNVSRGEIEGNFMINSGNAPVVLTGPVNYTNIRNNVIINSDIYAITNIVSPDVRHSIIQNNTIIDTVGAQQALNLGGANSTNNTITGNNISGTFQYGIVIGAANNGWTISNEFVDGMNIAGIAFGSSAKNHVVENSVVQNSGTADIGSDSGFVNTLYNVTHSNVIAQTNAGTVMRVLWPFRVYVNDTEGNAVDGATVYGYQSNGTLEFTTTTDATGYTATIPVAEKYVNLSGTYNYINYTLNATATGFISNDTENVTVDMYKTEVVTVFTDPDYVAPSSGNGGSGGGGRDDRSHTTCGDGICSYYETCNSCSPDCGECFVPGSPTPASTPIVEETPEEERPADGSSGVIDEEDEKIKKEYIVIGSVAGGVIIVGLLLWLILAKKKSAAKVAAKVGSKRI